MALWAISKKLPNKNYLKCPAIMMINKSINHKYYLSKRPIDKNKLDNNILMLSPVGTNQSKEVVLLSSIRRSTISSKTSLNQSTKITIIIIMNPPTFLIQIKMKKDLASYKFVLLIQFKVTRYLLLQKLAALSIVQQRLAQT